VFNARPSVVRALAAPVLISVTGVTPISSAVAVAAVRRGFRSIHWLACSYHDTGAG